ncbi:unannotated protein [freshwater metagenome]|uniref:PhoH-like protein n=1 Tax=freshwater metagenome TaxID=449393 RepID=A0A6J7FN29_9ZZZZ
MRLPSAAFSEVLTITGIDMVRLLGPQDRLMTRIEREYPLVTLRVRGNEITLTGDDTEAGANQALQVRALIGELVDLVRQGIDLTETDVTENDAHAGATVKNHGEVILTARGKMIRAKTPGQQRYVNTVRDNTIVFGIGPAGTGKTYLAMAMAVAALQRKEVNRIILTRPAVEAGERLGFLPGTLTDKIDPYLRPLFDALNDMMDPELVPKLMSIGTIEVAPLAYMRGRTLNDSFIILDEAQNTGPEQMKMFLTRLGFNSHMVITGDITQIDLPSATSGLRIVTDVLDDIPDIEFAYLGSEDVVRHSLVGRIVDAYTAFEERTRSRRERKR